MNCKDCILWKIFCQGKMQGDNPCDDCYINTLDDDEYDPQEYKEN